MEWPGLHGIARHCACFGKIFFVITVLNCVILSTAQTDGNIGLCSSVERATVTYQETYQVSRSHKSYSKCGIWGLSRCTRYRVVYSTQTRVAYRDSYNIVFTCCNGWVMQSDGSCLQNTSEEITTQSQLTDALTPSKVDGTTPTLSNDTAVFVPKGSPSSPSFVSGTVSGSPPGNISKVDGPRTLGKGGESPQGSPTDGEHIGMIGGLVGVAVAFVVLVSLVVVFVTKRKRQARDRRRKSDPAVVFQLLNANSPGRAPTPDIYTEIPDREGHTNAAGDQANSTRTKDVSFDDYDIAFINTKQPSGLSNTYQDLKEATSCGDAPSEASDGSPKMKKVGIEIRLGPNGAVFSKTCDAEKSKEVVSPYQNVPGLDTVVKAPEVFDTMGGNIPTDPDDEAYNMIIIGPTTEQGPYDKLDRQRGVSHLTRDDQLDTPIPAAPGYSTLGPESHLGYDKLERHEAHGVDSERKTGIVGLNTYDELGAQGRSTDYDKLARRCSIEHGLNDSGNRNGTLNGIPNGNLGTNQYDAIEMKKPADGEIYENLPKKNVPEGLTLKMPASGLENHEQALNTDHNLSAFSPPVVRPVYDVLPGTPRMPSAQVYDILPKSPEQKVATPVYDTPPAVQKMMQRASVEEPTSPLVGLRPVYDTPPVRYGNTCPLQFEETCPLYENTPTGGN
ncbi:uncharacterized protein LOC110976128 [Acanthaster planci]|uniref:Uncharacterized protein LOC110976128 n=1 Tax=Acanthaster planci TaxID=133434 RepID=A0A8B7XXT7_ACAPL|nr:uncharacterized protein LOC110976128 [Acanthaster planci]